MADSTVRTPSLIPGIGFPDPVGLIVHPHGGPQTGEPEGPRQQEANHQGDEHKPFLRPAMTATSPTGRYAAPPVAEGGGANRDRYRGPASVSKTTGNSSRAELIVWPSSEGRYSVGRRSRAARRPATELVAGLLVSSRRIDDSAAKVLLPRSQTRSTLTRLGPFGHDPGAVAYMIPRPIRGLTGVRCLTVLFVLALVGPPCPALAQHHGGAHSHGGSHSRSRSYAPRSHSHPRYYSSPRPYRHRHYAAPHHHVPRTHTPKAHAPRPSRPHVSPAPGTRDRHGRLKRSLEAKREFERQTGHPHGWPGHVIDHRVPLACGGADTPSNMQWQTTAEAKAKDRVERRGCR